MLKKEDIKDAQDTEDAKKKKSYKIPVILVIVWGLIIVLFAFSLWTDKTDENSNNPLVKSTNTSTGINMNTNSSPADSMTDEQKDQARVRDSKRLADIKMLRSALENYKIDNEHYPETLDNLSPDYLEYIPRDPRGQPYGYTGIGSEPYSYYDMSYILELGIEGIGPGMHVASPGGLATP